MKPKPGSSLRVVIVAFAAVVAAFVAAELFADTQLGSVDADTRALATVALPAIERLTALRTETHQLEESAEDRIGDVASGHGLGNDLLERALHRLDEDIALYSALGERMDEGALVERMRDASMAARELESRLDKKDVSGARGIFEGDLRPAVARADAELRRLVNVQAVQARELADRIEEVRNRARRVGAVLDALCVGLAALAATLAVRAVRRNAVLLEEHGRMQEERARELDQFASRVAHDVLSPLSAVTLALGQTKRHVREEAVTRSLSRAEASVRRVRTIVDGLLAFARAGARPEKGASTDARDVVTGIVEELRPEAAAERIELVVGSLSSARVACTAGVLSSVVANLMRNAIKYMGDGDTRRITVRSADRDAVVVFEVEDTGPGIPREMHEAIFESYVRISKTTRGGLGLGLATVKRLVLAHDGRFGVRSRPGEGATFWFELPRVLGPAAENVPQRALGSAE